MRPVITNLDERRLRDLLATPIGKLDPRGSRLLLDRLEQAEVVESAGVPPDVVTMSSRVACRSEATGATREMTLAYPWQAMSGLGRVSVMSQPGLDLLGSRPGQTISIDGAVWRIAAILHQPEWDRDSVA